MAETSQTRALCKMLRERRGVQSYPMIASKWTPEGWPDRLFSHKLFGLALVEFKGFHTPVTPMQYRRIRELHRACVCRFRADWLMLRIENEEIYTDWFESLHLPEAILAAMRLGLMKMEDGYAA